MSSRLKRLQSSIAGQFKRLGQKFQKKGKAGHGLFAKVAGALKKEAKLGPVIHAEALSALRRMEAKDPSLAELLQKAYAYAVIPRVGKASAVLGGAYGVGEVFVHDRITGYAAIVQMTLGVQLGGQTYNELVVFGSRADMEKFKQNKVSFAANASAVMVKAGAGASAGKQGMKVFVQPEGGVGIEVGIGAQKFVYIPAALGRVRGWLHPVKTHGQHAQ